MPTSHGADGDHGRPYETIVAVAGLLNVEPQTRYTLDEETALVRSVLTSEGVALIAWEHKRIPLIANAILGDTMTAPQSWPDNRFDVVWIFDRTLAGAYCFTQLPQLLLGGDRSETI